MRLRQQSMLLLPIVGLSACMVVGSNRSVSWSPEDAFEESALIGTWHSPPGVPSVETILLRSDYTFVQSYYRESTYSYEGEGVWWLEYRPSGCIYLHLQDGRYFHITTSIAENGNRLENGRPMLFWDECEDRSIEMPDEVILIVANSPGFPHDIALNHMSYDPDSGDIWLEFTGPLE